MQELEFIRNGGETRRFHTWPVLRPQTVAEHSFHVAMLVYLIAGTTEPGIRVPLLMAALTHDLSEWQVGDIPAPAKRRMHLTFPGFRQKWNEMEQDILKDCQLDFENQLNPAELRILKLADVCEGALYCIRERMMGNKLIITCYINFRDYIADVQSSSPVGFDQRQTEDRIIKHIDEMWEQANAS